MGLFFGRRAEQRTQPAGWFGTDTQSQRVSADTATSLAPMFAALRHICDFCSTLPVDCFRRADDRTRSPAPMPALFRRLDEQGARGMVPWLTQAFFGLALGNAVGFITDVDGMGFPTAVDWLHWTQWSYDEYGKQWYVFGQAVPAQQIVHVPWVVPPGRRLGLSPIECYAAIMAAGMSAQQYADVRRGGGLPPTLIKNNQRTVPPDVIAAMKTRSSASFARGEPFVIGNDWDFSAVAIPPNHVQFIETLKLTANQIAAAYGVDPREVGGAAAESLTYSTDESRGLNRAANMRPYLLRAEAAFAQLLPERQYVRFNVDATIRADVKTRTEVLGAEIADGRRSVNEARTLLDLSQVPGGDYHNVPAPKADPTMRSAP